MAPWSKEEHNDSSKEISAQLHPGVKERTMASLKSALEEDRSKRAG